ncbi:hemicentin-1-like isoform X2 [Cataglyphis hispanica]|uniref:hemicentin-1-like isoform X2 n=1 Tax=Cataglyphis hispanica TaxID=1086592 RepID=UPI00217FE18B|nr:hemicentin-1-like isoform X2 [Cataglyphis hispanica]
MLPPRILSLLVILLAVQGLCKPTKSTEDVEYEDDTPIEGDDEEAEEIEDDNVSTAADVQPQILSQRMSIRVKAGSTVILPCQVMNAENYVVAWIKGNKMLYFEMQPQIEDSKRIVRLPNNSLAIYNATVNDSSNNYTCSILWQPHSVNLTHRLLVDPIRMQPMTSPPPQDSHKGSIRVIPARRVEVNQGVSLTLGCETDMLPPPEIKWFIEAKKVVDDDPQVILKDNYITITKVNRSHSGVYQCLAEDGSKSPAMEAINVIVFYVPEIEVKRNVVHSGEGIESEMTCIVSAHPEAVIKWFKDDKEISYKKGSIVIHHGVMKNNKTKHVLKIIHTSTQDFGEYKCRAQNVIGQTTKSIILTGVPSQPRISGAEMTSDDAGIILKWHLESYSPIKEYKLQYRRKDEEWNFVEPEVKDGKGNQFFVEHPIEELQPGSYEAVLTARNAFGWSMPSAPHKFTGDYPSEMAQKDGNSAAIQIRGTLLTLILVLLSCAFTSL